MNKVYQSFSAEYILIKVTDFKRILYSFLGEWFSWLLHQWGWRMSNLWYRNIQWSTRCNYLYTMYQWDSLQLPKDQLLYQIVRTFPSFLSHLPHVTQNSIKQWLNIFPFCSLYPDCLFRNISIRICFKKLISH